MWKAKVSAILAKGMLHYSLFWNKSACVTITSDKYWMYVVFKYVVFKYNNLSCYKSTLFHQSVIVQVSIRLESPVRC